MQSFTLYNQIKPHLAIFNPMTILNQTWPYLDPSVTFAVICKPMQSYANLCSYMQTYAVIWNYLHQQANICKVVITGLGARTFDIHEGWLEMQRTTLCAANFKVDQFKLLMIVFLLETKMSIFVKLSFSEQRSWHIWKWFLPQDRFD